MFKICFAACFITCLLSAPTAVFHGMGDQCSNKGMQNFADQLGQATEEYSTCIEIGSGSSSSIMMDFKEQAIEACENLKADPQLNGKVINVVGLSQGALIARSIVQECDFGGSVEKLLSIGGPQMGVSALPHCKSGIACYPFNFVTKSLVYSEYVQSHIGPAGYFRDTGKLDKYLSGSHFLPDLNNERDFQQQRKDRFSLLKGVMLVKFNQDTMINPRETAWFQSWNESGEVTNLEDSDFYKSDLIGLKQLNEGKKVQFISIDGNHLEFSQSDITNTFVPFLKN